MDLIAQIIALLGAKFQGVRRDALTALAGTIALQVDTKEEAEAIVAKLGADKVNRFVQNYRSEIDKEIQKSNQTYEETLKKKYDFVEKKTDPVPPPPNGVLTLEQIEALFDKKINPLTARMDAFDQKKTGELRRETYVSKMKEAKVSELMQKTMLQQFDRMTFKDEDDFNQFLTDSQPTFAQMAQEESNSRLRNVPRPSFGGNNNGNEGVSQGMKDYLESKKGGGNGIEGKTL